MKKPKNEFYFFDDDGFSISSHSFFLVDDKKIGFF